MPLPPTLSPAADHRTGVLLMVGAAFFFSLMTLCVKLIGTRLPALEVVFFRNVFSLVVTAWYLWRMRTPWRGQRHGLLFVRGLLGFVALVLFFYAIPRLPLAEATLLHFLYPVFTAILAPLVLGEPTQPRVLAALALCLAGLGFILAPQGIASLDGVSLDLLAVGAALLAAFLAALAYTAIRALQGTPALLIVLYLPLVAVPASVPFLIPVFVWPTPTEWAILLGIGIFTQIAQVLMTYALLKATVTKATTGGYAQIVFATLWGLLIFSEVPPLTTFAGMVVICLGIALAARK
ncbi:MAG: DMT family transporter [Bacteroidota bacterium]